MSKKIGNVMWQSLTATGKQPHKTYEHVAYMPRPNLDWSWRTDDSVETITVDIDFITSILNYTVWLEDTLLRYAPDALTPPVEEVTAVCTIDQLTGTVTVDGVRVQLGETQERIAAYYATIGPGTLTSLKELNAHIYGEQEAPTYTAVRKQLQILRKKVAECGVANVVEYVQGVGTRLNESVTVLKTG
jgi:hypothetical protein